MQRRAAVIMVLVLMFIVLAVAAISAYSLYSSNDSNYYDGTDKKKSQDYEPTSYSFLSNKDYKNTKQIAYNSDLNYNPDINSYYDDSYNNRNKIIYYLDDYDRRYDNEDGCYYKIYNNRRDKDDDTEYYIYHYDDCNSRLRIRYNYGDPYYELHGRNYYLHMYNDDGDCDYYYDRKGRRHYGRDCDDRYDDDDDRDESDDGRDYGRNGNDDYKSINYPHDGPLGGKHLQYHKEHNTLHYREDHMG